MKRKFFLYILALLLTATFIACGSSGGGDGDELTAPDMGSPSDLPASGAATAPADKAEALAVFDGGMGAFGQAFSTSTAASRLESRATETINESLNWVDDGVTVTGSMTGSAKYPDESWTPAPNTTYNDIISIVLNLVINGTLDEMFCTNAETGHDYVISGKLKETLNFTYSMDLRTDATGMDTASGSLDYSFGVAFGVAFAIWDQTADVGAKFIISFADSMADRADLTAGGGIDIDVSFLENAEATLTVYNDANVQIYTAQVPLSDIDSVNPESFLGM